MASIKTSATLGRHVLEPGRYVLKDSGPCACSESDGQQTPALMVTPLGDFVACWTRDCRVNGHLVLGGVQLLEDGDVIDMAARGSREEGNKPLRFEYRRQGPAIRFRGLSELRCAYSRMPLHAGAVRCTRCLQLYHETVWMGELDQTCPRCSWCERE